MESIIPQLPGEIEYIKTKLERLRRVANFPANASVLDLCAAQGVFVGACEKLGFRGYGVEPWDEAHANARRLSEYWSVPINIVGGVAENIPFAGETLDVVHAHSVIEHVTDVDAVFAESFRVLKIGGVFWFSTASSIAPHQGEIDGFPLFGWYPDSLKIKIMNWAKENKPELIGYTDRPAVHWFTPWKARRLLRAHGFGDIYDRWDLRLDNEQSTNSTHLMKLIRKSSITKLAADAFVAGCAFAAIK